MAKLRPTKGTDPATGWSKLTDLAFALCLGVVLARGMMMESVREAFGVYPGQETVVRAPLAGTTAVLDLLMYLPALLIGMRCIFDDSYRPRRSWSVILLAALGVLALVSMTWSADRFAAAVSAGELLAGAAVLWTAIQWVRDWGRLRVVCALLCGMLAVNLVYGIVYTYVEFPATRAEWEKVREPTLKGHGMEPGSFSAQQFERKIMAAELMGFCASPNSLAAVTATIMVLLLAMIAQQRRDGAKLAWSIVPALLLAGGIWIIYRAASKTAAGTPLIGLGLIIVGWRMRGWMSRHRGAVFGAGCAAFVAMWVAIIAHGIHHGTLFQRSLTFRWHYWVASLAMFRDHLLAGVGWDNFGQYYTQYRLPIAPEEISDPHNLFVRFATELGIGGLLLGLGWVAAIFWEGTAPQMNENDAAGCAREQDAVQLNWVLVTVAVTVVVACLSAVDMSHPADVVLIEVLYRVGYGLILLMVTALLGTPDMGQARLRQEPAPWLLVGLVAAIVVFFVHNMIDFAASETGPFYLFIVAVGALLGIRYSLRRGKTDGGVVVTAKWAAVFVATGIIIVIPAVLSEGDSRPADDAVARERLQDAARLFEQAFNDSGWLRNPDYLERKAMAQMWGRQPPTQVRQTLDRALAANPRDEKAVRQRAHVAIEMGDAAAGVADFQRAVQMDPQDVELRIEAGEGLERLGMRSAAADAYAAALANDDRLPADEIKRLPPSRVEELRNRVAMLRSSGMGATK